VRPAAHLQAAIDLLDAVIRAAGEGGAAADTLARRWFQERRYAGARDRAAVRDLLFDAIRAFGDPPPSGRAGMIGLALSRRPDLIPLFDGSEHGPAPIAAGEPAAVPGPGPRWLLPALRQSLGPAWEAEMEALLMRAPLDIRVNRARVPEADVAALAARLPAAAAPVHGLPLHLPWALRLTASVPLEQHADYREGLFEIQDAGSQFVARAVEARPGETILDLCAGAGGKTLALAADMLAGEAEAGLPPGRVIAADTDRSRLRMLGPRGARAGAAELIATCLLDPGREMEALAALHGSADAVLVDAPCSGSGTWRRNPELRWRLDPARLDALVQAQRRLLGLAAALVRPGGRLVYAVCSVLDAEGRDHLDSLPFSGVSPPRAQTWQLTPAAHGCDGFFVARWDFR
jgi:16S rRNA (cytosine967-C5)-methyltransferase